MDAPDAPDPKETAAAQGAMNKEQAVAQAGLNMTNQRTPWGSLEYKQIGTWDDGTPRFEASQTLSPENQNLYNQFTGLAGKLGAIGNTQATNVADTMGQPFKLGNEATEARLMELGRSRLDPKFQQQGQALETELMNRGIMPGTEAYKRARTQFGEQENDAYNQLVLQGRAQAGQELLTERNQPLNEMTALLSGTQVQQPQYANTPQTPVSGVDYAGLVNNNYNQEMANYQGGMGGLFGTLGTVAGGWARAGFPGVSDRRMKTDIRRVGKLDNGLPVYSFKLKGSKQTQIGVMADETEKLHPEAVVTIGGIKHVRYEMAVN